MNPVNRRIEDGEYYAYKVSAPKAPDGDKAKAVADFIRKYDLNCDFLLENFPSKTIKFLNDRRIAIFDDTNPGYFELFIERHPKILVKDPLGTIKRDLQSVYQTRRHRFCLNLNGKNFPLKQVNKTKAGQIYEIGRFDIKGLEILKQIHADLQSIISSGNFTENEGMFVAYSLSDRKVYCINEDDQNDRWMLDFSQDPIFKINACGKTLITEHLLNFNIWDFKTRTKLNTVQFLSPELRILDVCGRYIINTNRLDYQFFCGETGKFLGQVTRLQPYCFEYGDKLIFADMRLVISAEATNQVLILAPFFPENMASIINQKFYIFNPKTMKEEAAITIPTNLLNEGSIHYEEDKIIYLSKNNDVYVVDYAETMETHEERFRELPTYIHLNMMKALLAAPA